MIPEFYNRNPGGIPEKWVARIRESMARLTPEYSANRAVRQYTEEHYIPAAIAYAARTGQRGKLGGEILAWQQALARNWSGVSFGPLKADSRNGVLHIEVAVHLGELDPQFVRVELFAEGPVRKAMERGVQLPDKGYLYTATVEANRPASDFTARLVPYHPSASVPLEAPYILWHDSPSWK